MIVYQINIIPKWAIDGYENYIFSTNKKLFNIKTGKEIKPTLKGYTVGYYLNGKFLSKKRPLIKKYVTNNCPF